MFFFGVDGFFGWPSVVNFADQGNQVLIIDNLSRRNIDNDLEVESFRPIASIGMRLRSVFRVSRAILRWRIKLHSLRRL